LSSDEADDPLEAVELELLRRRFGDVVRSRSRLDVAGCSNGSATASAPRPTRYEIHGPLTSRTSTS
jgi:hypothetical protein